MSSSPQIVPEQKDNKTAPSPRQRKGKRLFTPTMIGAIAAVIAALVFAGVFWNFARARAPFASVEKLTAQELAGRHNAEAPSSA